MPPRPFESLEELTEAERTVIAGLPSGHIVRLGDGRLPGAEAGADRRVRASVLRWLALGGDGADAASADAIRLPATGLRIAGALVVSDGTPDPAFPPEETTAGLDLQGCTLPADLVLVNCRFEDRLVLLGARLQTLILDGSILPGLYADRLRTEGGVFLRGATVEGAARLLGARLGGDLSCTRATLRNLEGPALGADGLRAEGDVFLSGATVEGEARLLGARLGGDLDCDGATLRTPGGDALFADGLRAEGDVFLRGATVEGVARLRGTRLGGNLSCVGATLRNPGGDALVADGARIEGSFFWRQGATLEGRIDLTAAEIGDIDDDPACYPAAPGCLVLERCVYGAFTGQGVSAEARIPWLDLQRPAEFGWDFRPQPWEHCAKVLRETGHPEDARAVLIAKEIRQRADRRRRERDPWMRLGRRLADAFTYEVVRHGHRPLRAALWLGRVWLVGAAIFWIGWQADVFKPNNPFILRSAEWVRCAAPAGEAIDLSATRVAGAAPVTGLRAPGETRAGCFLATAEGAGFPSFNPWIYSADVLFPLVEIGQQDAWVPDEDTPPGVARQGAGLSPGARGLGAVAAGGGRVRGAGEERGRRDMSEGAAARVEALFTRSDGGYRFARWERDLAPAIMGTEAEGERLLREGLAAAAGLAGRRVVESDPDLGANYLVFLVDAWPRLKEVPGIERLIPDIDRLISVLGASGANQYRIFDFEEAGAIRLTITLLRLDADLAKLPPRAFALSQAVMGLLLWSDRAFLGESPVAMTEGGRAVILPEFQEILRAAYAPDLPAAASDPAHAGEIAARMGA